MIDSLNNKELVAVGNDFAKAMTCDTPTIEIAKMMSQLAERLDCTTAALRETANQRDALASLAGMEATPVAWLWSNRKHPSEVTLVRPEDDERAEAAQWSGWSCQALYAAPQPATVVSSEIANKLKADGVAELLKDASEYAPLTAGQWESLANNWHQTFIGLAGDKKACRVAMLSEDKS